MPPKAKVSKNAASVKTKPNPKPKSRKLLKIKGGTPPSADIIIEIVCVYYDAKPSIESNINSLKYSNLYYKDGKQKYYLPTIKNMIDFLFASDDTIREKLNKPQYYNYSGKTQWSAIAQPFINAHHFGILILYKFTSSTKQYEYDDTMVLVRGKKPDSILRCFKLIKKNALGRTFALFQKKSDQDSDYIVKEFPLYYGVSLIDEPPSSAPPSAPPPSYQPPSAPLALSPPPSESAHPSSSLIFPPLQEVEDNNVYDELDPSIYKDEKD
jgi:hypothetical protein